MKSYSVRASFILSRGIDAEEPQKEKLSDIEAENPDDAKQQTMEWITSELGEVYEWCHFQIVEYAEDATYLKRPEGRRCRIRGADPVPHPDEDTATFVIDDVEGWFVDAWKGPEPQRVLMTENRKVN